MEELKFFAWMLTGNLIVLLFWVLVFVTNLKNFIFNIHNKIFRINKKDFNKIHYQGIVLYKTAIILFLLIPYITLRSMN
jgi:hypothetical protein|tara:strand:- start:5056 stop:5292 length:237 start_codon:yes stop_codon:yes gene_type:complete